MSEKLKPCPFCGSSELLGFETSHEGGWTIVKCRKCGCSGSTGRSTSEQEATAFWNRRATHHAPAEQVEVVAYRVSLPSEPEIGHWLDEHAESEPQMCLHEPLMSVAQHERITAAMAADAARWQLRAETLRQLYSSSLSDEELDIAIDTAIIQRDKQIAMREGNEPT